VAKLMGKHARSTDSLVLGRIRRRGPGWVFTPTDFGDLGSRTAVADSLFGAGNYEIAWMPFPSWFDKAYTPSLAKKYEYSPDKAKALIKESGLTTPISTVAYYPAGSASFQRYAEIVQAEMKAVGDLLYD